MWLGSLYYTSPVYFVTLLSEEQCSLKVGQAMEYLSKYTLKTHDAKSE